jgi:hypothetical protein
MTHASRARLRPTQASPAGQCDCGVVAEVAKAIAEAEGRWYRHPSQYDSAPEHYMAVAVAAIDALARCQSERAAKALPQVPKIGRSAITCPPLPAWREIYRAKP